MALSAGLRFLAFAQTPYANGWDAYFYLVQLKAWMETGRLHSPEASLIYPYLWCGIKATGDYVAGFKAGAAALAGVWTGCVWAVLRRSGHTGLAWLGAAFMTFSPHLTYFAAQYPKNLLGLILFLGFVASLPKQAGDLRRPTAAALSLPLALLLLNYFGHRFTFALSLGFLLLWIAFSVVRLPAASVFLRRSAWLALAACAVLVLGARWFPGLLHWSDLERLQGVLTGSPQFAPFSFVRDFGFQRLSLPWLLEIGLAVFFVIALIFRAVRGAGGAFSGAAAVFCAGLLFPFLEWSMTGAAYRLFLVFVLLSPVFFAESTGLGEKPARALAVIYLLAAFFSWKSYDPARHDPPYALFDRTTAAVQSHFPTDTAFARQSLLFIAPNALAEFFTFTTGADAMPWLPEYPLDPAKCWRIAAGMQPRELEYFAPGDSAGRVWRLPGGYVLLREQRWQTALSNAGKENDLDFLERATRWPNPSRVRPAYLLRRKE